MTSEQVFKVCQGYIELLEDTYNAHAETVDTTSKTPTSTLEHACWMCYQTQGFVFEANAKERQGDYKGKAKYWDKAMRWLGFIQGILYMESVYSIEELKSHNRSSAMEADNNGNTDRSDNKVLLEDGSE